MNSYLISILSRADDVLISFVAIILVQVLLVIFSIVAKKTITPLPFIEMIIRPTAVTLIDKLNRTKRTDFALIIRGSIVFTALFILIFGCGILVQVALIYFEQTRWMGSILLMCLLSPLMIILPVLGVSGSKVKNGQYHALAITLNQNLITTDKHGLCRMSYKAMAIALCEWVIAPMVFYLLGGLVLAYLYATLSIFVRVTGKDSVKFLSVYGYVYRALNGFVSIITSLFILLGACFSAGGRPLKTLKFIADKANLVESAFAHAQNVILGGAGQDRNGKKISKPWLGATKNTAKLVFNDVLRGVIHYTIILFLIGTVLFGLWVL